MIHCQHCGNRTHVIDSRNVPKRNAIRRRMICLNANCGRRFTTYEEIKMEDEMSTNCIRCVERKRTGTDLLCDDCRKMLTSPDVIVVRRACPIGGQVVPHFNILTREHLDDDVDERPAQLIMETDAIAVFDALTRSLPRGTLDRIAAMFVKRLASDLIINDAAARSTTVESGSDQAATPGDNDEREKTIDKTAIKSEA